MACKDCDGVPAGRDELRTDASLQVANVTVSHAQTNSCQLLLEDGVMQSSVMLSS